MAEVSALSERMIRSGGRGENVHVLSDSCSDVSGVTDRGETTLLTS